MSVHHFTKLTLIYLSMGFLLSVLARPFVKTMRGVWIVLFPALAVIVAIEPAPANIIYLLMMAAMAVAETRSPRNRYENQPPEAILNVIYIVSKRAATPMATMALLSLGLLKGQAPWGLSAHGAPVWVQAIVAGLAIDFKQYWVHRGQHHFDFWWRFHKVHHYSEKLSVVSHGSTHIAQYALVEVSTTLFLVWLLGIQPLALLWGYVAPEIIVTALWSHANIDFPSRRMPFWTRILSSPNVHALHHSTFSDRCNYGQIFVFWDMLFGTFRSPIPFAGRLNEFGVGGYQRSGRLLQEQGWVS